MNKCTNPRSHPISNTTSLGRYLGFYVAPELSKNWEAAMQVVQFLSLKYTRVGCHFEFDLVFHSVECTDNLLLDSVLEDDHALFVGGNGEFLLFAFLCYIV